MNLDCPKVKIYQNGSLLTEFEFYALYSDLIMEKCAAITETGVTVDVHMNGIVMTNVFNR